MIKDFIKGSLSGLKFFGFIAGFILGIYIIFNSGMYMYNHFNHVAGYITWLVDFLIIFGIAGILDNRGRH